MFFILLYLKPSSSLKISASSGNKGSSSTLFSYQQHGTLREEWWCHDTHQIGTPTVALLKKVRTRQEAVTFKRPRNFDRATLPRFLSLLLSATSIHLTLLLQSTITSSIFLILFLIIWDNPKANDFREHIRKYNSFTKPLIDSVVNQWSSTSTIGKVPEVLFERLQEESFSP